MVPRKIDESKNEEFSEFVDLEKGKSPSYDDNTTDIAAAADDKTETSVKSEGPQHRISRVPFHEREKKKHIFEPLVVSLGPYHHGQPQCRQFEEMKDELVNFIFDSAKDKSDIFYSTILERVDKIRVFYGKSSVREYSNEKLANMIYRDACFILYYMEWGTGTAPGVHRHFDQTIGSIFLSSMEQDYLMLENQIPWWVIKLLIQLKHDDDGDGDGDGDNHGLKHRGRAFILEYLTGLRFYNIVEKQCHWKDMTKYGEPLHLLELFLTFVQTNLTMQLIREIDDSPVSSGPESSLYRLFRSATELQAKGIYFKPSSTRHLNDIQFNSYPFYGVLRLPRHLLFRQTMTVVSNLVALEMSPGHMARDPLLTPFVNFMKSLIESPNDVRILRESGILVSYVEDDEQIVKMFNEINTHGTTDPASFDNIKTRINEHCNSKAKTWMAELIHTYFRSPWTVIGLVAATFLLCLSFLQTYYTINPKKQ